MINLTVKTLDSRNHQFSVEDDITVEQFKQHIADTVNIPAETQRIIYCGRVLQDSSKLNDYDVDGKVVHLVQRPPPSANTPNRSSRSSSPHPQRRVFRGIEHGNTMFLGSVAFPTNLMDSQGIVPPPPTHSHAGSRLNVAKRMLRKAEQIISQLENPNGSTEIPAEDPQEEMTPVIEARVFVPSNGSEPLDQAAILSAVQDYSFLAGQNRRIQANVSRGNSSSTDQTSANAAVGNTSTDSSGEPQAPTSSESSTGFPENGTRTSSMGDLLSRLSQLQLRFAPFLQRYHEFMRDDPVVPPENVVSVQMELNRVSEVMHFLSHAYHSLSDIIVRVRTPPPRPLLCRPILIQHSAVLQTGVPMQVGAQINLSNERSTGAPTSQSALAGEATPPNTTAPTAVPQPFPSQTVPLISTVRVPIPLEIRGIVPSQSGPYVPSSASFVRRETVNPTSEASANNSNTPASSSAPTSTSPSGGRAPPSAATLAASNPEVEFIMEVTPEGITIDSLETAIIGSNQADDLLRGALNGQQTPNLIQSIMQMAGQFINRRTATPGTDTPSTTQQSSATSAPPLTPTPPTQNSQARGNNQTHPTSSTHTRSTSRPHVHLQQQTMQGGFDPFLPCNSHHVPRRRPVQVQQQPSTTSTPRTDQSRAAEIAQDATSQLNSLMNSIVNTIRTTYQMRAPAASEQTESSPVHSGAGEGNARPSAESVPSAPPADQIPVFGSNNMSDLLRNGPTLAQIMQQLPPDVSDDEDESVIADFVALLTRNLTLGDMASLNGGSIAPLSRITTEIQNFFVDTLLNGSRTREAIDSAVERVLNEMQPFLETLTQIPMRDDIDIESSVRRLLRARLPPLLQLSSRLADQPENLRLLVDQFVSAVKEFWALALHACADGLQGVEEIMGIVSARYMHGIPADLQETTLLTTRRYMCQLMANLNVPLAAIEAHIVRKSDNAQRNETADPVCHPKEESNAIESEEPMEIEDASASANVTSPTPPQEEVAEPLPNVVIGSEPWHNQVPADWVPIITRDTQRQKKQHSQPPFSDAYLSGMPSKRRKLVHGAKGRQGLPLPQIIAESVRRAVTATGLSSVAPLEVVAQAAGSSSDIQTAYRGLLKSSVQAGLKDNNEFTPERFPNATNYFGRL